MTETTSASSPAGATRLLYRDPNDRTFAGVCAALGRYTDTDPVIWRIATVVLAVFGGTGVALYVLGWILIPKIGEDRSIAQTWLNRPDGRLTVKTVLLIALALVVIVGGFDDRRGIGAVAVLAVLGYLVYRERQGQPIAPPFAASPPASPSPAPPYAEGTTAAPAAATWPMPPPVVREPRVRSRLGLLTVSLAALVSGAMVWAGLAGNDGITAGRVLAVALLIVGGGLLVGTWVGRARWLIAVGLVLSLGLGVAAAADAGGVTLQHGLGQRTWVVGDATSPSFALGVGEARLDLTQLPPDGPPVVVHAAVSLGHLVVVVPNDVPVRVHATVRVGQVTEFGTSLVSGSTKMERTRTYGPPGNPRVQVEASVGTGDLEVQHG